MNRPLISVLIPVYNVETYLEQCLKSVVSQTLEGLEIICVNDGSTDSSLKILKEFAGQYSHIKLIDRENGGYGSAINLALSYASGEYVGIVEPDDYIAPDMYSSLYEMAVCKDKPDIVKAGWYDVYEDPQLRLVQQPKLGRASGSVFNIFEYPAMLIIHPSVWSAIYRRDFLEQHQIRMVEARGAGWVDNPFMYETYCRAKTICWMAKPVYYYRCASLNSSSVLKDCSIPISRMTEVFDFLDARGITHAGVLRQTYTRVFIYLRKITPNPNLTRANIRAARKLVARMDREIVCRLNGEWFEWYDRYCPPRDRIQKRGVYRIMESVKAKYSDRLIGRACRAVKRFGLKQTFKKAIRKVLGKS